MLWNTSEKKMYIFSRRLVIRLMFSLKGSLEEG